MNDLEQVRPSGPVGLSRFKVATWPVQAVGWVGGLFFSFILVLSLCSREVFPSVGFAVFVWLSLLLILRTGTVTATFETLGVSTLLGRFEIPWRDVQRIERGSSFWTFFAGEKRMSVPAPDLWLGRDKPAILSVMWSVIYDKNIEMKVTARADCLFSKGTKVR